MSEMTVEEFVEFWESTIEDSGLAIDWMVDKITSEVGQLYLSDVISALVEKHGTNANEKWNLEYPQFNGKPQPETPPAANR